MKITVPDDCGNSPRNLMVSQFSVDWASGKSDQLRPLLADDVQWDVLGGADPSLAFQGDAQEVEIFAAINHGKVASCNGRLRGEFGEIDFCHVFRFSGASKTAKIVHVRSYLVAH